MAVMKTLLVLLMTLALPTASLAQALTPEQAAQKQQNQAPVSRMGVPELRALANKSYTEKDYPTFRNALIQLHQLRPNNSDYMYQLVLAHALNRELSEAFNIMLKMQRQGLHYDFDQTPDSGNLRGTELYRYLNSLMVDAGNPLGDVTAVTLLDEKIILPEAIAWDENREAFIIGTVREGLIVEVKRDGSWKELVRADEKNRIWAIYGIAIDADNNRLYATTTSDQGYLHHDPVDKGRSALLEFQLDTMELIKRYPVPVDGRPHNLGNLAIAPNGNVYIADSMFPILYVRKAGAAKLEPFFTGRQLVNLRGLDVSGDGRLLYLVDYEMGIMVLDLEKNQSAPLAVPETLNLGGIDGLSIWNNSLVVVQNGISPERVIRLDLDESRTGVVQIAPMAVAHEKFEAPTYGTVIGNEFFFFANSQWSASSLKPVLIASLDIVAAKSATDPQIDRLMKDFMASKQKGNGAASSGKPPETEKKE